MLGRAQSLTPTRSAAPCSAATMTRLPKGLPRSAWAMLCSRRDRVRDALRELEQAAASPPLSDAERARRPGMGRLRPDLARRPRRRCLSPSKHGRRPSSTGDHLAGSIAMATLAAVSNTAGTYGTH